MVEMNAVYKGQLSCTVSHGPSGCELITDAPKTLISEENTTSLTIISGNLRNGVEITGEMATETQFIRAWIGLDPMGDPLEAFFHRYVESPLSNYIANVCVGRAREPNWKEERALRLDSPAQARAALGKFVAEKNLSGASVRDAEGERLVVSVRGADAAAWLASLREMTSELPLRITAARIARAGPGLVDGEVTLAPVGQKWQ